MSNGIPIEKQSVYAMKDGSFVVDWGDGQAQDLMTGEFLRASEADFSHVVYDRELDILIRRGRVIEYDSHQVFLAPLPEGGRKMLD
ncbi:MAG: hypothetical protein HY023_02170 [Chloroflexi bacterium]|nr:hypothetical protein [Chloroflexota bacterium]MBI3763324.1 hypothetical protein [Chloroflexota bacterium]